jgi:hypothetical protein
MTYFLLEPLDSTRKLWIIQLWIIAKVSANTQPRQGSFCILACHCSVIPLKNRSIRIGMFEIRLESLDKHQASEVHVERHVYAFQILGCSTEPIY